jgi:ferredoxin
MKEEEGAHIERFIFKPVHDHVLQALLMILGFFLVGTLLLSYWYWQRASWQRVGVASEQPVPFSHQHHVAELGIDCRYCHTGVEKSSYAGVPPTETCMTCHSQIWTNAALLQPVRDSARDNKPIAWTQVTSIPNYVYFNHSAHINRGVACVSCHGRIDQMPMTYQAVEMKMSWCLACHRQPDSRLVPISQVTKPVPDPNAATFAAWHPPVMTNPEKARMTNCTVCHR